MHSYRFKIGGFVIDISVPEPVSFGPPYSLFLCDGEKADIYYTFDIVSSLPEPKGDFINASWNCEIYNDADTISFFYNSLGPGNYSACRFADKNDFSRQSVLVRYNENVEFSERLIFSLIDIEDIPAMFSSAVLHASFIDVQGEAVLFTAPCETGKSTQADLWHKYRNAEIINGDKALISATENGCFAHGIPFAGTSGICKNRSLKLKAIVRLGQAPENTIKKLRGFEAYRAIFEGCYQSVWSNELSNNISAVIEKIVNEVPVYRLDCVPDETAVEALEEELFSLGIRE